VVLKPGRRGRRFGTQRELTAEQKVGIQKVLVDKAPDPLKLSFCPVDPRGFAWPLNTMMGSICRYGPSPTL